MKKFEYEITTHPAETFRHISFFCTEEGQCTLQDVPEEQIRTLAAILNTRGTQGWELMQISFGKGGIMAFWKRKVKKDNKEKQETKTKKKTKKKVKK